VPQQCRAGDDWSVQDCNLLILKVQCVMVSGYGALLGASCQARLSVRVWHAIFWHFAMCKMWPWGRRGAQVAAHQRAVSCVGFLARARAAALAGRDAAA
jgi:hypothetical protein